VIGQADLTMTVNVSWAAVNMVPVSLDLRTPDGQSAASGVWVRLESPVDLPGAAVVSIQSPSQGAVDVSAPGRVRVDATSDASGHVQFSVPVGSYTLTLVPGSDSGAATLTQSLDVASAGISRVLTTVVPVTLSGALLPLGMSVGVRIFARDQTTGIRAPLASTVVDANGHYAMSLPPGRTYELEGVPATGTTFARSVLGRVALESQAKTAPDYVLGKGKPFVGVVSVTGGAQGLAGAVVQVFCGDSIAACTAPDRPIAEATTRSDGAFTVVLPEAYLAAGL
jgi:hypothetical protein